MASTPTNSRFQSILESTRRSRKPPTAPVARSTPTRPQRGGKRKQSSTAHKSTSEDKTIPTHTTKMVAIPCPHCNGTGAQEYPYQDGCDDLSVGDGRLTTATAINRGWHDRLELRLSSSMPYDGSLNYALIDMVLASTPDVEGMLREILLRGDVWVAVLSAFLRGIGRDIPRDVVQTARQGLSDLACSITLLSPRSSGMYGDAKINSETPFRMSYEALSYHLGV